MNYFYYVATEEKNGKYNAFVIRTSESGNLMSIFRMYGNLKYVNPCKTMKKADELANAWNDGFIKNGTYLFD